MKKFNVLAVMAIFVMSLTSVSCDSQKSVTLKSGVDTVSYLMGSGNAKGLGAYLETFPGGPGNIDAFLSGFSKSAKGDTLLLGMTEAEAQTYVENFYKAAQAKEAEANLEAGKKFLSENKSKSDVITLENGMQYKVLVEGTGPKPALEDTVQVHYTLKLLDGKVIESSVGRGEPVKFPLGGGLIQGWQDGVQLMPKGSKYILWIPSELAYGPQGNQGIKPNTTLEFEIELLDVFKAKK